MKSNRKHTPTPIKKGGEGLVSSLLEDIRSGKVNVIYQSPITTDSRGRACRTITFRGNKPGKR